jgi:hypothetical protein
MVYNDPSWNYSQYEFKNFLKETAYAAAFLNATNTDYTSFQKTKWKNDHVSWLERSGSFSFSNYRAL